MDLIDLANWFDEQQEAAWAMMKKIDDPELLDCVRDIIVACERANGRCDDLESMEREFSYLRKG